MGVNSQTVIASGYPAAANVASLALALSDRSCRYAMLLGSGVSRGAGMPTGWEVVEFLIQRYAEAMGEQTPADPHSFWREFTGQNAAYDTILPRLARTPSERQALLEQFWLPTEDEREQGFKVPGVAHQAIAHLASMGALRMLLTTNFDSLLEQALDAAGVAYRLLASGDDVEGAPPYAHGGVFVVKICGDYRDTRILNTIAELSQIDTRMESYLKRILDDFGLIVCGWSGDWDVALADLIRRSPNRRYTTWWALRGEAGKAASLLIERRDASVILINDADSFLQQLQERVEALIETQQSSPESPAQAAAVIKYLLKNTVNDIRLRETILREADRIAAMLPSFLTTEPQTGETLVKVYEQLAVILAPLRSMLATLCFYGVYDRHSTIVADALRRIVARRPRDGNIALVDIVEYWVPAITADAAAFGAYMGGHLKFMRATYGGTVVVNGQEHYLASHTAMLKLWPGVDKSLLGSEMHCGQTYYARQLARELIPLLVLDSADFDECYLEYDYVRSVAATFLTKGRVGPFGEGLRLLRIRHRVDASREAEGEAWPPVTDDLLTKDEWNSWRSQLLTGALSVPGYER